MDTLTSISGVEFEEAWAGRIQVTVDGVTFGVLGREELIRDKRATGRPKDLMAVETLLAGPDGTEHGLGT